MNYELMDDLDSIQDDYINQIFNLSNAMYFKNWKWIMLILDNLIPIAINTDYQLMQSNKMKLINQQIYREFKHAKRVSLYAKWLSEACSCQNVALSEYCGFIHDIGKLMIDPAILYKEENLLPHEWALVKHHLDFGVELLSLSNQYQSMIAIIKQHHERWDGKGYPCGLKANDLFVESRILSIVDAYDAMTCNRSYRNRLQLSQACDEIKRCAGTQFDPEIAFIFTDQVLKQYDHSIFNNTFLKVD